MHFKIKPKYLVNKEWAKYLGAKYIAPKYFAPNPSNHLEVKRGC